MIDLGDLVSGQEIDVPLRFSFPFGDARCIYRSSFEVQGKGGVFGKDAGQVAWVFANDGANDVQPREREVDRLVAAVYAARARRRPCT